MSEIKVKKSLTYFILAIVIAVASLVLGILMIPGVTDLGKTLLKWIIAAIVLVYAFSYLLPKAIKTRGQIQVLSIVELVIMALIGLGSILSQFNVIKISQACAILGLAILMRGVIGTFTGYVKRGSETQKKYYGFAFFCVNVALIILGTWMLAAPFFTDAQLIIVMVVSLFVICVLAIAYAILCYPKSKGTKKSTKSGKKSK